ncbi:small acid-soluble spore protein O [Halalkalibacterium ligniniphilum]|uniref:small acid-soluble spore protein O n=1 Tax=Halalkalibacterium ligniniphilum TaxID=1134413 RepID=UPI00034D7718|nr:small acid-soluble spore protein O [Halalkalibacterium ligniniphilum]
MTKKKSNHMIPGMNAASNQGKDSGYTSPFNQEIANEPLSEEQRQNNKKTKKRQ